MLFITKPDHFGRFVLIVTNTEKVFGSYRYKRRTGKYLKNQSLFITYFSVIFVMVQLKLRDMIRTVVTTNNNTLTFAIPDRYIGKELEVIAFAKDEGVEESRVSNKKVTFTVLHTDIKNYKFSRDEANER